MTITRYCAAALLAFLGHRVQACLCVNVDDNFVSRAASGSGDVFLGRAVRLVSPREADVEVIEAFSGSSELKRLVAPPLGSCTSGFGVGVPLIFAPAPGGKIFTCSTRAPDPDLLERLRNLRRAPETKVRAPEERAQARADRAAAAAAQEAQRERERIAAEAEALARKPPARLGMTQEQVLNGTHWGRPVQILTTSTAEKLRERWMYSPPPRFLDFDNGRLVLIQD